MEQLEVIAEQKNKGLEILEAEGEESTSSIELVPSSGDDIMVFARTPEEMARAQGALLNWSLRKIEKVKADIKIAEDNFAEAKAAKIRTAGWRREVRKHEKDLNFYTKIHDALEAGYFIVPEFPLNIIGVRTDETIPTDLGSEQRPAWINAEEHKELPIGEGEYVDPRPKAYSFMQVTEKDGKEKKEKLFTADGTNLQKMDFPFRLVRPQLLKDLSKAAELKIFDAIGVLPNKRRTRDPMLVGVIESRVSKYNIKRLQFLISWWIPTADL